MQRTIGTQDLEDACSILEYLIHDLVVAHRLYDLFGDIGRHATVHADTEKSVRRMYISHILLALQKFSEFYKEYGWLIPNGPKTRCREIHKELNRRQVRTLRHTFIGHILNKKTGRPISNEEIDAAFNTAVGNDVKAFLNWIHVSGNTTSPGTVVGVLRTVQKELQGLHNR